MVDAKTIGRPAISNNLLVQQLQPLSSIRVSSETSKQYASEPRVSQIAACTLSVA